MYCVGVVMNSAPWYTKYKRMLFLLRVGVSPLLTFTYTILKRIAGEMMRREQIEELISNEVEKIIDGTPMELVDVEYIREKNWYLRVYIDKEGGVDLEDCQHVSQELSRVLDADDPIPDNYLLEVSSPGLDRILKKDKDFLRYAGRTVDIHFFSPYEGAKDMVAQLIQKRDDGTLAVAVDGLEKSLDMKNVAQVRLHIDF